MIVKTPALSIKKVNVFGALFKAQMPDTVSAIRNAIPEWVAAHVILDQAGTLRKAISTDQMRSELLAALAPQAMLFDPIFRLTSPEIPPGTFATFVPDQMKPKLAPQYQGWNFVFYKDSRAQLATFLDAAIGGTPEGQVGIADALIKGPIKGQAVVEGWSGGLAIPTFRRTLEGMVEPNSKVMFWDTAFGFESSGESFVKSADQILGMPDSKHDRVYFDATAFSWFVALYPGGQLRAAMLA